MLVDEKKYKRFKKQVEDKLEKYYYYLISIESPGLGQPTQWDKVYTKSNSPQDPVSNVVVEDEYKRILVNAIENVFDRLDGECKKIIEEYYFKGNVNKPDDIIDKLRLSKNRYYELKKLSLYKFMIGLGYC